LAFVAALVVGLAGAGVGLGVANAAPSSDTEYAYVITYGRTAVCPTLDTYPTFPGVEGVLMGILDDGFTPYQAGEILALSVSRYCIRHMPLILRWANAATPSPDLPTSIA
jgi:hypothetical protein